MSSKTCGGKGYLRCKKDGDDAESAVTRRLESLGFAVGRNDARDTATLLGWDLSASRGSRTVRLEVKYDRMAARTGNLAIEFANSRSGGPSGIDATTADYWVVVLSSADIWVTAVASLRAFVRENPGRVVFGGDDNSVMRLYPKEALLGVLFRKLDSPGALKDEDGNV